MFACLDDRTMILNSVSSKQIQFIAYSCKCKGRRCQYINIFQMVSCVRIIGRAKLLKGQCTLKS